MQDDDEIRPYMRLTVKVTRMKRKRGKYLSSSGSKTENAQILMDVGCDELASLETRQDVEHLTILAWGRYGTVRAKDGAEHKRILDLINKSSKIDVRLKHKV